MGSDAHYYAYDRERRSFNSRSRMGSDPTAARPRGRWPGFNSRSRMGSDKRAGRTQLRAFVFQFTLPHGERPTARKIGPAIFAVSIHAPAWGATWTRGPAQASPWFQFTLPHGERLWRVMVGSMDATFQFTLPHGERRALRRCLIRVRVFQFTLPHGERRVGLVEAVEDVQVSIHAPAWGATRHLRALP